MAVTEKVIHLFIPGRLCLFGEHSDWAGMYRFVNSSVEKGYAIVSGVEQGIYATAEKADRFIMCGAGEISEKEHWECEMDTAKLLETAQKGGYFSYVAGVASYINDNYSVGGIKITVEKRDLPMKSGLSSSAAVCVLVARAFNQLYNLKMNVKGEMQAAFSEHRVVYNNNPILRWCLLNTAKKSTKSDSIEMIQPVKIQANRRIDGCVSLLNAWVGYVKHYDDFIRYIS